jgi:hypothetical protein
VVVEFVVGFVGDSQLVDIGQLQGGLLSYCQRCQPIERRVIERGKRRG